METVKGRLCLGAQYDCIQAENTGLVESHKYWVSGKSLEKIVLGHDARALRT